MARVLEKALRVASGESTPAWGQGLSPRVLERGRVVLDQPQQLEKHRGMGAYCLSCLVTLLRLVFDTAALLALMDLNFRFDILRAS